MAVETLASSRWWQVGAWGRVARLSLLVAFVGAIPVTVAYAHRQEIQKSGDPGGVLLTRDAITRLATFWTAFAAEADSIRSVAGIVGTDAWSLLRIDTVYSGARIDRTELVHNMPAVAARYPSVSAALRRAGLTPQEYTQLVTTLLTTCRTLNGVTWGNPVTPTPREVRNMAFFTAQRALLQTLVTRTEPDAMTLPAYMNAWRYVILGDCVQTVHHHV